MRGLQHITVLLVLVLGIKQGIAQIAMPDTVCVGVQRTYKVNGTSPLSTYTWTIEGVVQGSNTNAMDMTWNSAGIFLVTVQEHSPNGCDGDLRSGFVYVEPLAKANAGSNQTVCFGTPVQLNGSGGSVYQWTPSAFLTDTNIASPVANIPAAGVYSYILNASSNNSCHVTSNDTVVITVLPQAVVFAGNDTTTGPNAPLQLHATDVNGTGFIQYNWSPLTGLSDWSVQSPVVITNADITYTVSAISPEGCTASDAVTVRISPTADIYVPSAFAPNGINNLLHAIPVGIRDFRFFAIYNRYGELVFRTSNPSEGWDGKYKGIAQNSAGFVWVVEGVGYNGKVISKKGNVVLIR